MYALSRNSLFRTTYIITQTFYLSGNILLFMKSFAQSFCALSDLHYLCTQLIHTHRIAMLQKLTIGILLSLLLILKTEAKVWTPDDIPMPYLTDIRQHVSNPDGVLSSIAVDSINTMLQQLERVKGVQAIAIAVKNVDSDDPYAFCMGVGKKYGIGARNNTGLIIFLASEDRSYQILTGNGLEGTLPDALCRRVQNHITIPLLKQQKWNEAMMETTRAISLIINGDDTIRNELEASSSDEEDDSAIAGLVLAFLVIFVSIVCAIVISQRHKCPKCGARMRETSRQRVRINGSPQHRIAVQWHCPKCGHKETRYENDSLNDNGSGGVPPLIFPTGSSRGPSSFSGGTFGGGTFGGGGSGGHF